MSQLDEGAKRSVRHFLDNLHKELNRRLPGGAETRERIQQIMFETKGTPAYLPWKEAIFIRDLAIPVIFDFLQQTPGISEESARESLLCEFYKNMQHSTKSAARTKRSPFDKGFFGECSPNIMRRWKEGALSRACPDFAFGDPFPFKIVFEGKYFPRGSRASAEGVLVESIYETFLYRSMPHLPALPGRAAWSYDFGCLLAYDGSDEGTLLAVWNELPEPVKLGFWDGANVFVMIVRGTSASR